MLRHSSFVVAIIVKPEASGGNHNLSLVGYGLIRHLCSSARMTVFSLQLVPIAAPCTGSVLAYCLPSLENIAIRWVDFPRLGICGFFGT